MKCFFAYEANEKHFSLIHGAKIHIFLQSGYRVCFASFRFCKNRYFSHCGRGRNQFFFSNSRLRSVGSDSPLRRDTGSAR